MAKTLAEEINSNLDSGEFTAAILFDTSGKSAVLVFPPNRITGEEAPDGATLAAGMFAILKIPGIPQLLIEQVKGVVAERNNEGDSNVN